MKVLCATLLLLLAGCAQAPVVVDVDGAKRPSVDSRESWWYVRFRMRWPEGEEPLWYPDLLLADRVLGPVLEAEEDNISLWRFHRRAARDEAGRRFSFIFRATPATAARVNALIKADPWVARLRKRGILEEVLLRRPKSTDTVWRGRHVRSQLVTRDANRLAPLHHGSKPVVARANPTVGHP